MAEVRYAVRYEMAQTLVDILERRTRLAFVATESACTISPAVAKIAAAELGWDKRRTQRELDAFARQCEARLAWRDSLPSN
jgi:glycerol-3-phosphate dehydrogenase